MNENPPAEKLLAREASNPLGSKQITQSLNTTSVTNGTGFRSNESPTYFSPSSNSGDQARSERVVPMQKHCHINALPCQPACQRPSLSAMLTDNGVFLALPAAVRNLQRMLSELMRVESSIYTPEAEPPREESSDVKDEYLEALHCCEACAQGVEAR